MTSSKGNEFHTAVRRTIRLFERSVEIEKEEIARFNKRALQKLMRKILLISALIFAFALGVSAQKSGAAETVKSFYVFHNSRSGLFSLHEVNLRRKWFTAELYKLFLNELKREDEFTEKNPTEKPHYGDGFPLQPFSECVDGEKVIVNTFEVKEISSDAATATVEVKFYSPEKCKKELIDTYKVELVKTKSVWRISDWIFPDKKRLTDDLKRKEY